MVLKPSVAPFEVDFILSAPCVVFPVLEGLDFQTDTAEPGLSNNFFNEAFQMFQAGRPKY